MTTFNENDHPRSGGGQFTNKEGSAPEVGLSSAKVKDSTGLVGMTKEQVRELATENFHEFMSQGQDSATAAQSAERAVSRAVPSDRQEKLDNWAAKTNYDAAVRSAFSEVLAEDHAPEGLSEKQRKVLFDKAWEQGHASGYHSVENEYIDLAEFVGEFRS